MLRKFYLKFLHVPEKGHITENVFMTRLIISFMAILVTMVALCSVTYAYFTTSVTTGFEIETGDYTISVTQIEPESGISVIDANGVVTFPGQDNKYNYEFELTANGEALQGFCKVTIVGGDNVEEAVYYTHQIFTRDDPTTPDKKENMLILKISAEEDSEITKIIFEPHWGTSSAFGNEDGETYGGDCAIEYKPTAAEHLNVDMLKPAVPTLEPVATSTPEVTIGPEETLEPEATPEEEIEDIPEEDEEETTPELSVNAEFIIEAPEAVIAGEEFTANIILNGYYEAYIMNLQLNYNCDAFELVSYANGNILEDVITLCGTECVNTEINPGSVLLETIIPIYPFKTEGTILTLTFRANEDINGEEFSKELLDLEVSEFLSFPIDGRSTPISFNVVDANVNIVPGVPTPVPVDAEFVVEAPKTVIAGEEFTANVIVSGDYEAYILKMQLDYNSEALELINCSNGSVLETLVSLCGTDCVDTEIVSGSVCLDAVIPIYPFREEGTILSLTFRANEDASGEELLDLTVNNFLGFPVGGRPTKIEFTEADALIEITAEEPIEVPVDAEFIVEAPETIIAGEEFTANIMISGDYEAYMFNMMLNYNSDVFELVSYANGNFIDKIVSLCGTQYIDIEIIPGSIRLDTVIPVYPFKEQGTILTLVFQANEDTTGEEFLDLVVTRFLSFPVNGRPAAIEFIANDAVIEVLLEEPTETPIIEPTETPSVEPIDTPTIEPIGTSTMEPIGTPVPSKTPTIVPTETLTVEPTGIPADELMELSTEGFTETPTDNPDAHTNEPSGDPTDNPDAPTVEPSGTTTAEPTTDIPGGAPTGIPEALVPVAGTTSSIGIGIALIVVGLIIILFKKRIEAQSL